MDPITVLHNRIQQLEAKLGLSADMPMDGQQAYQGDSATANLLNAAATMNNATAGHEKLSEAMQMATELNNYTDPNSLQNMQDSDMKLREVEAAEPMLRHHCQCMHKCRQAAPLLESEAIAQVPQMQTTVDQMQAVAKEVKKEADAVSLGVKELSNTCGAAASAASEQLAEVAQKVENAEDKMFPKRRNGLD